MRQSASSNSLESAKYFDRERNFFYAELFRKSDDC